MKRSTRNTAGVGMSLWLLVGMLAGPSACCTTTSYTESEIESKEFRDDANARVEEERDEKLGQEGGENAGVLKEEAEQAVEDSNR